MPPASSGLGLLQTQGDSRSPAPILHTMHNEKRRQWRKANRKRANAQALEYYYANRDKILEQQRLYRELYPERKREIRRLSSQRRPHRHTACEAKRRARKRQSEVYSCPEVKELYRRASDDAEVTCFYCGCDIPFGSRHVDHVVPLSRCGSHTLDNLVIACATCNLRKGTQTAEEFLGGGA